MSDHDLDALIELVEGPEGITRDGEIPWTPKRMKDLREHYRSKSPREQERLMETARRYLA